MCLVLASRGGLSLGLALSLLATLPIAAPAAATWPTDGWETATPESMGMDSTFLAQARDYAMSQGGGAGFITRGGRLVMSWGFADQMFDIKSTTKSIGATILGLAVGDGLVGLDDNAVDHYAGFGVPPPENGTTGWLPQITLEQLATHTAGFEKSGGFINTIYEPGTTWAYSDGGTNWLADVLTVVYGDDLRTILFDRVLTPLGLKGTDLFWYPHGYRGDTIEGITRREFGSGMSANVDALARIGYLYLRNGAWEGSQVIPAGFVGAARHPVPWVTALPVADPATYPGASQHYGLLWWNNADGVLAKVPPDAYWAWGLGEILIVVIPSLDVVVSRAGLAWQSGWSTDYSVLKPFLEPIAQSVYTIVTPPTPPSPPSPPPSARLGPIVPSPFRSFTDIGYAVPRRGTVTMGVYDLRGRKIREWRWSDHGEGEAVLRWDGRADDGERVATGVYFIRFEAPGATRSAKTVVLE